MATNQSPFFDPERIAADPKPFRLDEALFRQCIEFPVELPPEMQRDMAPIAEACARK